MSNYLYKQLSKPIPQTEPLDVDQVKNNAGGYSYKTNLWAQLDRFLLIGTEGGTFYVDERKLTFDNIKIVDKCLESDGLKVLNRILDFSINGRAYKQDPILYTLARAFCYDNTKKEAELIFNKIVRTGYHLFLFISFLKSMRGMGKVVRRAVSSWYLDKNEDDLSYQLLKYQTRNGWSHKDVLRQCHAPDNRASIRWALGLPLESRSVTRYLDLDSKEKQVTNYDRVENLPSRLEKYKVLHSTDNKKEVISLIESERFTHEMVPNNWKNDSDIWFALMRNMPVHATLRNLGKLSTVGLLKPFDDSLKFLENKLESKSLSKSKIHPMAILVAGYIYRQGHGMRGKLTWKSNNQVRDILESAFYRAFPNVEPTGKNLMLGVDVSGSMTYHSILSGGLTAADLAAAMALITVRTEPNVFVVGFSTKIVDLSIGKHDSLSDVLFKMVSLDGGGGTDCAAPIEYALVNKIGNIDAFISYTDNETWAGGKHPADVLKTYRKNYNKKVNNIVVAMTANDVSIASPKDPRSLDIAGFDSAVPSLISEFVRDF